MGKYELGKTVEAHKLNKRTGIPLSEPPVTIPFGAILESVQISDDMVRFAYMGDRYQVSRDAVAGALHSLAAAPSQPPAAAKAAAPAATDASDGKLIFETLDVRAQAQISIYRAPVPGGWLVASHSGALTFVPDAAHKWDGSSLKPE